MSVRVDAQVRIADNARSTSRRMAGSGVASGASPGRGAQPVLRAFPEVRSRTDPHGRPVSGLVKRRSGLLTTTTLPSSQADDASVLPALAARPTRTA